MMGELVFSFFSRCRHLTNVNGRNIKIETIRGPTQLPIKIGEVSIEDKLLEAVGTALMILDWYQYSSCQRIQFLRTLKPTPNKAIVNLVMNQEEASQMITYLALIATSSTDSSEAFERVLSNWLADAQGRITQKEEKDEIRKPMMLPTIPGKDEKTPRGIADATLEIPEILNTQFESKFLVARESIPYLKEATKMGLKFDILENIVALETSSDHG